MTFQILAIPIGLRLMPKSRHALIPMRLNRRKLGDQIADVLIERLAAGELQPGERLPSEPALAALFGASVPVVRDAVAILIRRNLVHRRHGKGSFVRADARDWLSGRATRQGVVGLAIRYTEGADYFGQVFNQVCAAARIGQWGVQALDPEQGAERLAAEAVAAGLAGVVWAHGIDAAGRTALAAAHARLPVVLFNVEAGADGLPAVRTDDHAGGMLAASHLLERGHRRIGVITNFTGMAPHRERLAGMAAAGMAMDPELCLELAGYRPTPEERQRSRALARRCSALVLTSGYLFTALLGDLAASGRGLGDDLALLVFDDFESLRAHHPPVTAVRQPIETLATQALELIADAHHGLPARARVQALAPQLVPRDSTARTASGR